MTGGLVVFLLKFSDEDYALINIKIDKEATHKDNNKKKNSKRQRLKLYLFNFIAIIYLLYFFI